jgi:hypothetical protein
MRLELRRQPGDTDFCVPAALALLTGATVGEVADDLHEFLGDQPISGIYFPIALAVLKKRGFQTRKCPNPRRAGTYFCCNKSHAFVISDSVYYDNSFPNGSKISKLPRLSAKHGLCFEVTKEL